MALDEAGRIAGDNPLKEDSVYTQALDDIELIGEAGNAYDADKIATGEQTPIFFGSALTNFGVKTFLESFVNLAPAPEAHKTQEETLVEPTSPDFSGSSSRFKPI